MKTALLLAIFAAIVFVCSCSLNVDQDTRVQACGWRLNLLMEKVCRGTYRTLHKKSLPDGESVEPWDDSQYLQLADESLLSILGSANKDAMVPSEFQRQRRGGIVDECCKRVCTLDYLKTYCGR